MRSRTSPPSHPDPTLVAADAVAPDSRTERLNTRAAGVIGIAVMCSRLLGLVRELVCAAQIGRASCRERV